MFDDEDVTEDQVPITLLLDILKCDLLTKKSVLIFHKAFLLSPVLVTAPEAVVGVTVVGRCVVAAFVVSKVGVDGVVVDTVFLVS